MYRYLSKLKIDIDELRRQVTSLDENKWEHWVNPNNKIVKSYKQVYLKDTTINIDHILNQMPITKTSPIVFLRYDPYSKLKPHTDWNNTSAILIGISDHSSIIFWKELEKIVVPYTAPTLVNLEEMHSVENNLPEFRYLLKIPFKLNYKEAFQKFNELI
jgi:hypothetical protein